jgi:hypothetical protein
VVELPTILVLLGSGVVVCLNRFAHRQRRPPRRALMRMPETPIAGVKDGDMVRITGRAVARAPLRTSPISQRRCIGFRLIVDRHDGQAWQRVVDQEQLDSFLLTDDTGEAVLHGPFEIAIDPYDARSADPPPELFSVLEKEGVAVRGPFGTERHFHYVETVLLPGDEITAVGRATVEIDAAGRAPSHRHPPVMCHLKGLEEAVVIADADDLTA